MIFIWFIITSIIIFKTLANAELKPHIEIRAVLANCPQYKDPRVQYKFSQTENISRGRLHSILPFAGFDKDELFTDSDVTECRKKVLFTIKINNKGDVRCENEFVVVDHVYDTIAKQKVRLINPYVFKLRNESVSQVYRLKLENIVNAEASEEVINNQCKNYTGCDVTSNHPTCGAVRFRQRTVPFSKGFCCSCDSAKNALRQAQVSGVKFPPNKDHYTGKKTRCTKTYKSIDKENCPTYQIKPQDNVKLYFNPRAFKRFANPRMWFRKRRQVQSDGVQARGGQNCADRTTPPFVNPEKYHESTHCLRFSDLWYSVHALSEPLVEHSMLLQVFEKQDTISPEGKTVWTDRTKGRIIKIGSLCKYYHDENPSTISIRYSPITQCHFGPFNLNPSTMRVLIPDPVPEPLEQLYPQIKGGPNEYLVVSPSEITIDGDECDKLGVSYKAFVTQSDRCNKPAGTCLNNQPAHLWYRDKKAELEGKKGCHFLKYFGTIPTNPIRCNTTKSRKKYLSLVFDGEHSSAVDIEINADDNIVVRNGMSARISEVHIDSSCQFHTKIIVKVMNTGYSASEYRARLTDCPIELPPEWSYLLTDLVTIPPFHLYHFQLDLSGKMTLESFHCSIEVINYKDELVAIRRIRIQRWDRCICAFYCLCACVGSAKGLKCDPMSLEHYHAAGFDGLVVPLTGAINHIGTDMSETVHWITNFGFLICFLLISGLVKGLIGISVPWIGILGLSKVVSHPHYIEQYWEVKLRDRSVVYDDSGWPVHPDTQRRTVRAFSLPLEFMMNVLFFVLFPFACTINLLWYGCCCCCPHSRNISEARALEWVNSIIFSAPTQAPEQVNIRKPKRSTAGGSPSTISLASRSNPYRRSRRDDDYSPYLSDFQSKSSRDGSTYFDNGDQESEDMKYVLNELHKSKLSLNKSGIFWLAVMFSAFKRLAGGKGDGTGATPPPGHQPMSIQLQRKFAKGIQYNMKVIIKGDRNVGKTCLFHRLQGSKFIEEYSPTNEIQVTSIHWNYKATDDIVKVEVWDVVDKATKKIKMDKLKLSADVEEPALDAEFLDVYKSTNGVILMMDITKSWTFDYVVREISKIPESIPICILGNHCDMSHHRTVTPTQISFFVESLQNRTVRYTESSMRNGFGLKLLHKFFNLPFLNLQRQTLIAQLERNQREIEATSQELDLYFDDADYQTFIDQLSNRRRHQADLNAPRTQPEVNAAPTIFIGAGQPIPVQGFGNNKKAPLPPKIETVPITETTVSVDEFCPEGEGVGGFLDDIDKITTNLENNATIQEDSESDIENGNPLVAGYQDDFIPEDTSWDTKWRRSPEGGEDVSIQSCNANLLEEQKSETKSEKRHTKKKKEKVEKKHGKNKRKSESHEKKERKRDELEEFLNGPPQENSGGGAYEVF